MQAGWQRPLSVATTVYEHGFYPQPYASRVASTTIGGNSRMRACFLPATLCKQDAIDCYGWQQLYTSMVSTHNLLQEGCHRLLWVATTVYEHGFYPQPYASRIASTVMSGNNRIRVWFLPITLRKQDSNDRYRWQKPYVSMVSTHNPLQAGCHRLLWVATTVYEHGFYPQPYASRKPSTTMGGKNRIRVWFLPTTLCRQGGIDCYGWQQPYKSMVSTHNPLQAGCHRLLWVATTVYEHGFYPQPYASRIASTVMSGNDRIRACFLPATLCKQDAIDCYGWQQPYISMVSTHNLLQEGWHRSLWVATAICEHGLYP